MEIQSPLSQVQDLVDRIFLATAALQLTGLKETEEQEVETYAKLMEDREPWVAELTALKAQITPAQQDSEQFEQIKQVIEDIALLDKAQLAIIQQMQTAMQNEIKEMKSGRKMTNAYNAHDGEASSYFDKRQ